MIYIPSCLPGESKDEEAARRMQERQNSDTHWRSQNGTGSFNWRFKFRVRVGHDTTTPTRLMLQLWDKDVVKYNDCIAETGPSFSLSLSPSLPLSLCVCDSTVQLSCISYSLHLHFPYHSRTFRSALPCPALPCTASALDLGEPLLAVRELKSRINLFNSDSAISARREAKAKKAAAARTRRLHRRRMKQRRKRRQSKAEAVRKQSSGGGGGGGGGGVVVDGEEAVALLHDPDDSGEEGAGDCVLFLMGREIDHLSCRWFMFSYLLCLITPLLRHAHTTQPTHSHGRRRRQQRRRQLCRCATQEQEQERQSGES